MKKTFICITAVLICFVCVAQVMATEGASDKTMSQVKAMGKSDDGKYKLALEYQPGAEAPVPACILVWAEPSHTLLLAHWNRSANSEKVEAALSADGPPLARTEGVLGKSQPRVIIPYEVSDDTAVVVEFVRPNGERQVVLGAQTSLDTFNVSSEFDGK
jgi:hypothetical protein